MLKSAVGLACVLPATFCAGLGSHLEEMDPARMLLGPTGKTASKNRMCDSGLEFDSSDARLVTGFRWAKQEAISYIRNGDPIGPWYYAALPGRNAFCMRDTSHMSTGAQLLGLGARTENMLYEFAKHISASKKWCSWWEITGNGTPASVDFKSDNDFWYDLPANFDVLNACYRQWLWSRNDTYIENLTFLRFYYHTVTSYVQAWENGPSELLETRPAYGHMGIPSYDEGHPGLLGADLIAAQYVAYRDYARIQRHKGRSAEATVFDKKATRLKALYNDKWWNSEKHSFYSLVNNRGKLQTVNRLSIQNEFPLYFGLVEQGPKTLAALEKLEHAISNDRAVEQGIVGGVETMSYLPNILYKYGRSEQGYRMLLLLTDPSLKRRSYPEVSFTVVGNIGAGLMGLHPMTDQQIIKTMPQLPEHMEFAELRNVPVGLNRISILHRGNGHTRLLNEQGPDLIWRASFKGAAKRVLVDKKAIGPKRSVSKEGVQIWTDILVRSGETKEAVS